MPTSSTEVSIKTTTYLSLGVMTSKMSSSTIATQVKNENTSYTALGQHERWQPGTRQIPYFGCAALLLAICGIIVSAAILVVSDGKEISTWKYQPTVYISIASTLINITTQYALDQGVVIAWWRKALRPGTRINDLHRTFEHGHSFWAALISGRHINIVAIAAVLVAISPVNGPLLQRASEIATINVSDQRNLDIGVQQLLPKGWTGYVMGRADAVGPYSFNFSQIVSDYASQRQVSYKSDCKSICRAKVIGAGFSATCDTHTIPLNLTAGDTLNYFDIFETSVEYRVGDASAAPPAQVILNTLYKAKSGCDVENIAVNCQLQARTVEYDVEINGNASTISLAPGTTIWDDVVVGPMHNLTSEEYLGGNTTYGGIFLALQNRFQGGTEVHWGGAIGWEFGQLTGTVSHEFLQAPNGIDANCTYSYRDPLPDMLQYAREMLFRSALASSNSSTIQQVASSETRPITVYRSNYLFFALATAVSIFAVAGVTTIYNGFWLLGRSMTLSPIETAKAFNAPLLQNHDSNADIDALLKDVGHRPVQYGAVQVQLDRAMHTFDNAPHFTDEAPLAEDIPQKKLQFADPTSTEVEPPLPGERYSG